MERHWGEKQKKKEPRKADASATSSAGFLYYVVANAGGTAFESATHIATISDLGRIDDAATHGTFATGMAGITAG